jgi:starch synthase
MKILFVSPEMSPFARTGGLGEVVGSLPIALRKIGLDPRVLCPLHQDCKNLPIKMFKRKIIFESEGQKIISEIGTLTDNNFPIPVYFLSNKKLFERNGIYAGDDGDYPDNWLRSCVLSDAAVKIENCIKWKPQIIHAHDWMAAPACAFLNAKKTKLGSNLKQSSVLTIHNLEHQGVFDGALFPRTGLPQEYWGIDGFEHQGSINLLKGGIQHADKITTVSPTYSAEVKTKQFGHGLEPCLQFRAADLIGILNGIDMDLWNPSKDTAIPHHIDSESPLTGKAICKQYLKNEFDLGSGKDLPLFGVVSRLYHQKGLDLLTSILKNLLESNTAQFIILGSGSPEEEGNFSKLAQEFPHNLGLKIGFDDQLARRIFAGTDFFIMPSRFEPCGLAQQYAMRYGSVPVARDTGGLSDTIISQKNCSLRANGYLFKGLTSKSLLHEICTAINDWAEQKNYLHLQKNAMNLDCSWESAAKKYLDVYQWSLGNP